MSRVSKQSRVVDLVLQDGQPVFLISGLTFAIAASIENGLDFCLGERAAKVLDLINEAIEGSVGRWVS